MRSCDMVIVVPVDQFKGNDEALRLQAWEKVSTLLRRDLGKLYRQFSPSGSVWEHKYPRPFGVVLGRQEPEVFRKLLKAGEEAQHEAVAYHVEAMLRKTDLNSTQKIGDMLLCSTVVDGSDPELLAHTVWNILIQEGAPVPDCGIYYASLGRASASEQERSEIMQNLDQYALCMVSFGQEAIKDA
mgnify:CR=1 FL=1